ncbi:RhoGAP protein [Trichoderma ceciliae]
MTSSHMNANQGSPPSQPALPSTPASPPNKRDLKSWWKNFKLPTKHQETSPQGTPSTSTTSPPAGPCAFVRRTLASLKKLWLLFRSSGIDFNLLDHRGPGIFGVPLRQSITYANVAISLVDEQGKSYIYGYVPIVVAKCGVFLKEKATGIEGIFRLSGSEKRIKELKIIFDSPDRYGKGLVWDGYTVHDAANVLRRYLNDLPEPVVPLDLYEKFRDPLRGATKQAVGDTEGPQFVENFDERAAIKKYQRLITELPPLNKQLLLYILDLLAVFAAKSDENRMNSQNLAAIFQPGMLSHPSHAMAPEEYRLNQCVIIFLIENQDHFLIGMQGTEADETTMQQVASGTPNGPRTPNPDRSSGLGRTASNASAGAESVRKDGLIRRNRSVSSRHSRVEGSVTPNSPAVVATPTGGGLARSNTVPSKKSPALVGGKFKKNESPGRAPHSPGLEPLTPARPPQDVIDTPNRVSTPSPSQATFDSMHLSPDRVLSPGRSQERLLDVPHEHSTPTKHQNLQKLEHLFQRSPNHESGDKRQPNKLKKKRIPGSMSISAQSSCTSLPHSASPGTEAGNPLETAPIFAQPIAQPQFRPSTIPHSVPQPAPSASTSAVGPPRQLDFYHQHSTPVIHQNHADLHNHSTSHYIEHNLRPEDVSRGKKSPPASVNSSFNEGSDLDQVAQEAPLPAIIETTDKDKKSRWRLSKTKRDDLPSGPTSPRTSPPQFNIGSNNNADVSTTSIGSAIAKPRESFTGESSEQVGSGSDRAYTYDSSRDDREDAKGPIGWIKHKYREAKESAEHKRNKSPPPSDHHRPFSPSLLAPRGKSLDIKRDLSQEEEKLFTTPAQHDASRDTRLKKANVPPPASEVYRKLSQADAAQREPAQAMTIHRVISETDTAPAEPAVQEVVPAVDPTKEATSEITAQPQAQATAAPQSQAPPPLEQPPLPSAVENKEWEENQA